MKAKAVTNKEAPRSLVDALNDLRATLEVEVLRDCFGIEIGAKGPAEFYVQETDFATGHAPFINYNLSGVTISEKRNFPKVLSAIAHVLEELVERHWSTARNMSIFIVIHASSEDGSVSKLIESEVHTVNAE